MKATGATGKRQNRKKKILALNTISFVSENPLFLQPARHPQQGVGESGPAGGGGEEHEAGTGEPHTSHLLHGHQTAAPREARQRPLLHAVLVLHPGGSCHLQPHQVAG